MTIGTLLLSHVSVLLRAENEFKQKPVDVAIECKFIKLVDVYKRVSSHFFFLLDIRGCFHQVNLVLGSMDRSLQPFRPSSPHTKHQQVIPAYMKQDEFFQEFVVSSQPSYSGSFGIVQKGFFFSVSFYVFRM